MPHTISLPSRMDISSVGSIREEWLRVAEAQSEIIIDCSENEIFTAAAAQLLVSLTSLLKLSGGYVKLKNMPASLREDFVLLGLPEYIEE